eukprot:4472758-Prymnesium_polylepis.2
MCVCARARGRAARAQHGAVSSVPRLAHPLACAAPSRTRRAPGGSAAQRSAARAASRAWACSATHHLRRCAASQDAPLGLLLEAYCAKVGLSAASSQIVFDGDDVSSQTAVQLELEDGDLLEVKKGKR